MDRTDGEFTIGAALSLSDGNVRQGRMAAAGLVQAVEDARRAGGVTVNRASLSQWEMRNWLCAGPAARPISSYNRVPT